MACSSLAELARDLKAIHVDLSGASPDFSKSTKPPAEMLDRWAEAIQKSYFGQGDVKTNLCEAQSDIQKMLEE